MKAVFIRVSESMDKGHDLRDAARHGMNSRFEINPREFSSLPRSPFAYWVSANLRSVFARFAPFESRGREAKGGMKTQADIRFLRLVWECSARSRGQEWVPLCKGGEFAPYYADLHVAADWWQGGKRPRAAYEALAAGESWGGFGRNEGFYFEPGLAWSRRSQRGFSLRALPSDSIFNDSGPAAFVTSGNPQVLLSLLGLGNSATFRQLMNMLMAFGAYQVGVIQRTPVPDLDPADEAALAALAHRAWSLKRSLDTRTETSHAFVLPALLQVPGETLAARVGAWAARVRETEAEMAAIQAGIDDRCFTLYGLDEEDRLAITEGFGGSTGAQESADDGGGERDAVAENEEEAEAGADATALTAEFVAWAVGVAFGRFDVHLATGARELPAQPEPFDPLPVCSPAMLTGPDGLPLDRPPAGYPIAFPPDGILVDDEGHPRDLAAAVRTVCDVVSGSRAEALWQEAAELLHPKDHDLRAWLRAGFFEHHLKRHSKSRRKAPILWQLGVPSARYSVWCYAHRLTPDSLFALARDIVAPKLAHEERRQANLLQEAGPNPTARQRAELTAQDALVGELRAFAAEVRRVAPLWEPDLDDGIVLAAAPLWRLVPMHKPWQKELKGRWDDLVAGKYDWAHLAMHLWPERVVPKCATDRSLAIAHGLEDVFWVEGDDGKWTKRPQPTRPIDELVAERTRDAVKAALTDLVAAPAPAGTGGRRKKGE
jgi:hypothetical protein